MSNSIKVPSPAAPLVLDGGTVNQTVWYTFFEQLAAQQGVTGTYLGLSGGRWDAQGYRLSNLGDPTDAQDAVTLNYLDSVITPSGAPNEIAYFDSTNKLTSDAGFRYISKGTVELGSPDETPGVLYQRGPGGVGMTAITSQNTGGGIVTFSFPPNGGAVGDVLTNVGDGITEWQSGGVYYWRGIGDADGTSGTDNTQSLQDAIDYCGLHNKVLFIGSDANGGYKYRFTGPIIISTPIDIRCDSRVILWWSTLIGGTYCITLGGFNDWYTTVELPDIVGPAIANISTGVVTYANLVTGVGGVLLVDNSNIALSVRYARGFNNAITARAAASVCYGHNIKFGVIENCYRGLVLSSTGGFDCENIVASGDTIRCQNNNVLFYPTGAGYIRNAQIDVSTQKSIGNTNVFIYGVGVQITYCNVNSAFVDATSDGSDGSPSALCQVLGGDQTVNTNTNCFAGEYCNIGIGLYGGIPAAGNPILYKLGGFGSQISYLGSKQRSATAVPLVAAAGEAGFNGGVGGALVDNYVYVSVTLGDILNPQAQTTFYVYHQALNSAMAMPIGVDSVRADLNILVLNEATATPRQARVILRNVSATAMAAGTVFNFYLRLP